MKLVRAALLSLAALVIFAGVVAAQNPMRAGLWEITMQMEMPNMPVKMPAQKVNQCITPEQIQTPEKALPSGPSKNPNDCKVSDYKTTGNTVTWKIACTGQQPVTGSGEMHFNGDTYEGVMNMEMQQGKMSMKYSGKRLGDCTK